MNADVKAATKLIDATQFRGAMRRVASTVAIVASGVAPLRRGMTATAVCSLTAEPAQILTCLNVSSATCTAIRANGHFSVNFLAASQKTLAERFAGSSGVAGEERFDDDLWEHNEVGVPVLVDAITSLICELRHAWPIDTHVILIGAVTQLALPVHSPPLVFQDGCFGTWTKHEVS